MRASLQRLVAVTVCVLAVGAVVVPGMAQARYTGSDYCAVQNDKGDWSLVGGASCNVNPSQNENSLWSQALILDFEALTATNAYNPAEVQTFPSLYAMLLSLSENNASPGWMYVANEAGNSGNYVYLMVNRASCAGNSDWAVAPVCDTLTPDTPAAPTAKPVAATPVVTG